MADGSVSLKWCTIIRKRRRCDPACAEDRPTDFGTVKGCEMAGLGTEIASTDRPTRMRHRSSEYSAQLVRGGDEPCADVVDVDRGGDRPHGGLGFETDFNSGLPPCRGKQFAQPPDRVLGAL